MRKRLFLYIIICILSFQLGGFAVLAQELELDIGEVSRLAIRNNFDIQVYILDKRITEKELLKAEAVYDTILGASYKYNEDRLDQASIIFGSKTTTVTQAADLSKKLPLGTLLSLSGEHRREATNSSFFSLNPYHESEASASITQPFGKNALGIIDRNTIKITRLDIENSTYTSLNKIERELADTQKAYWNLLLAKENLALTEEISEAAKNLYAANKENFDIGMVEEPELYAVEANLKQRQRDIVFAKDNLNSASNSIKLKLNLDKDITVVPKDDFNPEPLLVVFEDIIIEALNSRRDYKAAKNKVKSMDLSLAMKRNSLWPEIDLKATLTKNGIDKKHEESIREISDQDFGEYAVEIVFSFPLENSIAKAEYSQEQLKKAKALVNLKKTECLILTQTHNAFVHAKSSYDSAGLLKGAMELEHKKYLGEKNRFKKGRSDTDKLIRYQNDYLYASLVYFRSLYQHEEALIDLKVVMNKLLQKERI